MTPAAGREGRIRAQVDAQFPLLGPIVFCDGDAAAPDPVTGLSIPDFKIEASGEVSAAKVVTKAGLLAGRCYAKAVQYAVKLGGSLPACLPLATAQGLDGSTVALAGQFSDETYCASPNGAFVDGP